MRYILLSLIALNIIACEDAKNRSDSSFVGSKCRLNLTIKEEWSASQDNVISFQISAENIGELTIQTIVITANLYFKNDYMLKTRFQLKELKLEPGAKIKQNAIFSDTNTDLYFINGASRYDLDRIIYNAPFYTCLDN